MWEDDRQMVSGHRAARPAMRIRGLRRRPPTIVSASWHWNEKAWVHKVMTISAFAYGKRV